MPVPAPPPSIQPSPAALVLYAKLVGADSFESAVNTFVASLVADLGIDRASFGLQVRGRAQLLAVSDRDLSDPRTELEPLLTGAMDEAIEQGMALAYPLAAQADGSAAMEPILLEQRALHGHTGHHVASLPFGADGVAFGAVCVERRGDKAFEAADLHRLESLLMLAVPALRWMHMAARPWHQRAAQASRDWLAALRQPEKRAARRIWIMVAAALLFVAVAPLERAVSGRARVEGAQQRIMSAPADGFIKAAHVRPGDRVKAGAPLVDLVDEDLLLEGDRWTSQLAQHENAYAAAMAKSDRVAASTSFARVTEAQAQLALVETERARGRITSPVDALVVQGDLSQSIGAPVRQGDPLLTLATTGAYRVIVEVDEIDIAQVAQGQPATLVVSSLPWDEHGMVVERITPMAKAVNGRNVFEVEARPVADIPGLRPGLLGRAEIIVGRLPPLWSWTRHGLDRLRLTYWSWLA